MEKEKEQHLHGDLPPHLSSSLACAADDVPCLGSGMQVSARSPTPAAEVNQCKFALRLQLPEGLMVHPGVILTRISVRCTVTGRQERHKGRGVRTQTQGSLQLLPCYTNGFTSDVEGPTVRILVTNGASQLKGSLPGASWRASISFKRCQPTQTTSWGGTRGDARHKGGLANRWTRARDPRRCAKRRLVAYRRGRTVRRRNTERRMKK